MLSLHAGMRVHLALGATDMRKGFDGLAAQVQTVLKADPFSGHLFLFRGRRGDLLKALWWDGQGLVLLAKRLEKGRFIWPTIAREGVVTLTTAQLAAKHGIHQTMVGEWKRQAVEGMTGVFSGKSAAEESARTSEAEVEKLHAKIGQLLVERDFLAKASGR